MGRSKSTHPWAGTPCFLEPSKKKMPALESGPWWGSQLSKAWSAGHCIVRRVPSGSSVGRWPWSCSGYTLHTWSQRPQRESPGSGSSSRGTSGKSLTLSEP